MRNLMIFFLAVAFTALLAGCTPMVNEEQMIADANALDQAFMEAYNKQDVDGVMATYWNSPDLISYGPGHMELKGWEATKASLAKDFEQMKGAKLELMNGKNIVAGNMVIGNGLWKMTIPMPDGTTMDIKGRYTDVKAKKDGKMVYILDHASMPMPTPDDAAM